MSAEMTGPYRPSCGTEGMDFMEWHCARCVRDKAFQDSGKEDGLLGCPIAAASLCYDADDPKYPQEWRFVDGHATCTAFEKRDDLCPTCNGHGSLRDKRYRFGFKACPTCNRSKYVPAHPGLER